MPTSICPACRTDIEYDFVTPRVCAACGTDMKKYKNERDQELQNEALKYWYLSFPFAGIVFFIVYVGFQIHWGWALLAALLSWYYAVRVLYLSLGLAILAGLAYLFLG